MKKILIVFCALVLAVFSVITVGAVEESELKISADAVVGRAGNEVQISLYINENPGASHLNISLNYDETVLTKKSVTNGTVFATCDTARDDGVVTINDLWNEAGRNTTSTGLLGTYVFEINGDAAEGVYDVEIVVNDCFSIDEEAVPVSSQKGTVTVSNAYTTNILGADMELGADITVNYYAQIDPAHAGAQMKFTMNGKETVADGVETDGVYRFAFTGLAPQCMGDNIKAELILGGTVLYVMEEYSVKTYCENMLAKTAAELEMSAEKYAALETLIADLLEYGAQAQLYRDYKTDALVNEGVTGQTEFAELETTMKDTEESDRDGIMITAVGVYFDYVNSLYIKFLAPGLNDDNCHVAVWNAELDTETEYALSDCELINEETSEYLLVLDPVLATGYDHKYVIDLYAPRSATSDTVRSVHFLEYSVSSYIYSMQNKTDEGGLTPMAKLARATYNYGLSASAYLAIEN